MIRTISGKYMSLGLSVMILCWGLTNVWAAEGKPAKGKGKTAAASAKAEDTSKGPLSGTWSGTYTREGSASAITLDLTHKGHTVTGTLTVDAGTLPIDKGVYDPAEKKLSFEAGPSAEERYQVMGTLKGDTLTGQWKGAGQSGPFSVTRAKQASAGQ